MGSFYYFITLIDNYNRRIWISFLKSKDEAFGKFKEWHVMVEKESGRKLKKVRSDRGGEFTSSEFESYYKCHGIKRQKPPPHTPQQNEVVEHKMCIICEMDKSMMKRKDFPNAF